jgi:hypothetical protein
MERMIDPALTDKETGQAILAALADRDEPVSHEELQTIVAHVQEWKIDEALMCLLRNGELRLRMNDRGDDVSIGIRGNA